MNRLSVIMVGLLVIGLTVQGCAYMPFGQSDAGWTTLIDGATGLDNWNRVGDANWRAEGGITDAVPVVEAGGAVDEDRKSTRLNSSHRCISYAVFCLKNKKRVRANSDECE